MRQESATWIHIGQDPIPGPDPQRRDHARTRRGLGAEAQAGETEEGSRVESHDRRCEEGEEEAPAILVIPATAIEAAAGVEAGMGEAGTD